MEKRHFGRFDSDGPTGLSCMFYFVTLEVQNGEFASGTRFDFATVDYGQGTRSLGNPYDRCVRKSISLALSETRPTVG
jgi:hypothetical protein